MILVKDNVVNEVNQYLKKFKKILLSEFKLELEMKT